MLMKKWHYIKKVPHPSKEEGLYIVRSSSVFFYSKACKVDYF